MLNVHGLTSIRDEVLLPPGCRFQVAGVLPQGDLTIVQLEEVPSKEWIIDLASPTPGRDERIPGPAEPSLRVERHRGVPQLVWDERSGGNWVYEIEGERNPVIPPELFHVFNESSLTLSGAATKASLTSFGVLKHHQFDFGRSFSKSCFGPHSCVSPTPVCTSHPRQHHNLEHLSTPVDRGRRLPLDLRALCQGLPFVGGTRKFRIRALSGAEGVWSPWSSWCEVSAGENVMRKVEIYPRGLKEYEPCRAYCSRRNRLVNGIRHEGREMTPKPLAVLEFPARTTLGEVAQAAARLEGQQRLQVTQVEGKHGASTTALVPGPPPQPHEADIEIKTLNEETAELPYVQASWG